MQALRAPATLPPQPHAPTRGRAARAATLVGTPSWGQDGDEDASPPSPSLSATEPPPLVRTVAHGVVGASKWARGLRRELRAARASSAHVLIYGEPGLFKDKLAALVHFGSKAEKAERAPLAMLECARLRAWRLFGLADSAGGDVLQRGGALDWLTSEGSGGGGGGGSSGRRRAATLCLADAHALPPQLAAGVAKLLREGTYQATDRHGNFVGPEKDASSVRILLTAERPVPLLLPPPGEAPQPEQSVQGGKAGRGPARTIRVPPLRLRRADVAATSGFFLRLGARARGLPSTAAPRLGSDAVKLLESAELSGNERELLAVLSGAVAHTTSKAPSLPGADVAPPPRAADDSSTTFPRLSSAPLPPPLLLGADALWSPAWGARLASASSNLFDWFPPLKSAFRSPIWPEALNHGFTLYAFPVVVAMLLFGPQEREASPALTVFWAWWWPGVLATFPLVGRLWCAICPFMVRRCAATHDCGSNTNCISQTNFLTLFFEFPRSGASGCSAAAWPPARSSLRGPRRSWKRPAAGSCTPCF